MAKYVPDVKTQRWVIIASARTSRPHTVIKTDTSVPKVCPFCAGNEHLTPPETYRIGGGDRDGIGWEVRVVPNKFPITDTHEVIIHSSSHTDNIDSLSLDQVKKIVKTYQERYKTHSETGQVIIFCNHGVHAGASLDHPHTQLVVVPKQINLDALSREPITNTIESTQQYVIYCPDFSQWPFEVWIAPKTDTGKFGDIVDSSRDELALVLQKSIHAVRDVYNDPSLAHFHPGVGFGYNYYISHGSNWFIRIIPRFVHRAGFELGTGLNVNVVDPTEASKLLREKWSI